MAEQFDPKSIGLVEVDSPGDSGPGGDTGSGVSGFDPSSLGLVPVDHESFDPRSIGLVPVEEPKESGIGQSFLAQLGSIINQVGATAADIPRAVEPVESMKAAEESNQPKVEQLRNEIEQARSSFKDQMSAIPWWNVSEQGKAAQEFEISQRQRLSKLQELTSPSSETAGELFRTAAKESFPAYGASPEAKNVGAQIGRGVATVVGMGVPMLAGEAALPLMAIQGAGQAYQSTLMAGGTHEEALNAAKKTAPQLLLFLGVGKLASGLGEAIAGGASGLTRAVVGAGTSAVSNVATSSVLRALEAKPGERLSAAMPTIETLTADTLFGVYHEVGTFRGASLEAKRKAYQELQKRGFSKEDLKNVPAEQKSEVVQEYIPPEPQTATASDVDTSLEKLATTTPPVETLSPFKPQTDKSSIISTAIELPDGSVVTPREWNSSHNTMLMEALDKGLSETEYPQHLGFIAQDETGNQRFVDRKEALQIAREAGQVDESKVVGEELHSEHLKPIEPNAETIRSNQGQIPQGGDVNGPGPNARSEDLQQQAPGPPAETRAPQPEIPTEEKVNQAANKLQKFKKEAMSVAEQAGATDADVAVSEAQLQISKQGSSDKALFLDKVRKLAINQARAAGAEKRGGGKVESLEPEEPSAKTIKGPRAATLASEYMDRITEAMDSLPGNQGKIMRLIGEEGMSYEEASKELGITEGAVKQGLFRAREALKKLIQDEGLGMSMGPGAASANEILVKYELRKFSKRFDEDKGIEEDIRRATGGRYYEPIPNKVSAEEAVRLIDERGEDVIREQIKDEGSGLSYSDRTTVGQILLKRMNERYKALKDSDPEEASKLLDQTSELAEWFAAHGTRLGQGVQAYAMWNRMTPEGKLRTFVRTVQKIRAKHKSDNRKEVEEIKGTLNEATKESASKASTSDKAKAKLATAKRTTGVQETKAEAEAARKEKGEPRSKALDRDVWVQYQQQAIKNLESALLGSKPSETPALQEFTNRLTAALREKIPSQPVDKLTPEQKKAEDIRIIRESLTNRDKYEQVWTNTANALKLKYGDRPDVLQKIDEVFAPGLKTPLSQKTIQSLIKERLKVDEIKLSELVRQHYSKTERTGEDLGNKISAEMGLDPSDANEVARAVESQFASEVAKTKARALAGLVKTNKVAKKLGKDGTQKLIEASNLGALTDQTFYEAVSERLGLPKYDPEVAKEIMRLASGVEDAPEGIPKQEALRNLNTYIARQKGFDWSELPFGMYYGNMLSGLNTQSVNFIDTALNVQSEIATLMMGDPKAASAILSGALRGASEGRWDSMLALTEGRRISNGKLVEDPFFMEISRFGEKGGVPIKEGTLTGRVIKRLAESKGAKWLNAYKYIGRAMSASDTLAFRTAQEAKSAQLAWRLAHEQGTIGDDLRSRMYEILGYDRMEEFQNQAKKEGFTGKKADARAFELMELSRPEELQKASRDFASESTYNYKPYGVLGAASNKIEEFAQDYKALKLVVPFTRIVANVTNRGLNNSPYGYVRAWRGKAGKGRAEKVFSPEEKQALNIRATMGTVALSSLLVLHELGVIQLSGQGPSDPEKKKQLRETGWRPYSIKVGDRYYTYTYTPSGLGLAVMGNMLDAIKYKSFSQKDSLGIAAYALSSVGSTLFNQSFLANLSSLFESLSGGSPAQQINAMKKWSSRTVASVGVPFSGLLRDTESMFNPSIPKSDTFTQSLISSIPFASQALKPQLNAFGEPIKSLRNRFWKGENPDPVWKFVADRELRVPVASQFFDDPDQNYEYTKRSGQMMRKWMEESLPMLKDMKRQSAQDAMERRADYIRSAVRAELMRSGAKKKLIQK